MYCSCVDGTSVTMYLKHDAPMQYSICQESDGERYILYISRNKPALILCILCRERYISGITDVPESAFRIVTHMTIVRKRLRKHIPEVTLSIIEGHPLPGNGSINVSAARNKQTIIEHCWRW
jgi:hypothetical protein